MRGEAIAAGLLLAAVTLAPADAGAGPVTGATGPATSTVADAGCWDVAWRCRDVNEIRAEHGRARLDQVAGLQDASGGWADQLAASGVLSHDPQPEAAEIVGVGPDWPTVLAAFMRSDDHRPILLGPDAARVGVGVQRADGVVWVVVRFR